jgi:hypothetical protein
MPAVVETNWQMSARGNLISMSCDAYLVIMNRRYWFISAIHENRINRIISGLSSERDNIEIVCYGS